MVFEYQAYRARTNLLAECSVYHTAMYLLCDTPDPVFGEA